MSFKEINDLRKAGNLDDALQMVNRDLESEPDSIWIKRAASWVYYAYIKGMPNRRVMRLSWSIFIS